MVEVVHQVVWQELLLAQRRGLVSLDAQQQVIAETGPRMIACHLVDHLPICGCEIFTFSIFCLSGDTFLDDVLGFGRTVVVEIVVAIDAVPRLQVLAECFVQ